MISLLLPLLVATVVALGQSDGIDDALLRKARDHASGMMHQAWRLDYVKQKGADAQRWKPVETNDVDWFAQNSADGSLPAWARKNAHGGVEVDIADARIGGDVSKLPAGIKASNLDSSETSIQFALRELAQRGISRPSSADIATVKKSPKFLLALGAHIHQRWLSQNSWAQGDFALDRPFRYLAAPEARKDLSVGIKALDSLELHLGGQPSGATLCVDNAMLQFKDIPKSAQIEKQYKEEGAMREAHKRWQEESTLLKTRYNDQSLSQAERKDARRIRRENVLTRRYAGEAGRRAMALGDAFLASSPAEGKAYFDGLRRATGKEIVSAAGFSKPYADPEAAADVIRRNLDGEKSKNRFVLNGGVTAGGIGKIGYQVADELGVRTTGVVSDKALKYGTENLRQRSLTHQNIFVRDDSWGGWNKERKELNPTSEVFTHASDRYVQAGGGDIARDEAEAVMQQRGAQAVHVERLARKNPYAEHMAKWIEEGKQGPQPVQGPTDYGSADEVIRLQKQYRDFVGDN